MCDLRSFIAQRIHIRDIRHFCIAACAPDYNDLRTQLLSLASDSDDRVSYNALWIFTHFPAAEKTWLIRHRQRLTDMLLATTHSGKRRLLLTLLDALPCDTNDVRTDYLDFCMSNIISPEPYAVRAFCIKQAFAQCRHYPELLEEFCGTIQLLRQQELSPGLRSAVKNILKKVSRLSALTQTKPEHVPD